MPRAAPWRAPSRRPKSAANSRVPFEADAVRRLDPSELNDPSLWRGQIGRKASMRLRNPGDPTHPFTEAVGVVQSVERYEDGAFRLKLITRRGEARWAAIVDILAAKIF
jgi:hypothetical protein